MLLKTQHWLYIDLYSERLMKNSLDRYQWIGSKSHGHWMASVLFVSLVSGQTADSSRAEVWKTFTHVNQILLPQSFDLVYIYTLFEINLFWYCSQSFSTWNLKDTFYTLPWTELLQLKKRYFHYFSFNWIIEKFLLGELFPGQILRTQTFVELGNWELETLDDL